MLIRVIQRKNYLNSNKSINEIIELFTQSCTCYPTQTTGSSHGTFVHSRSSSPNPFKDNNMKDTYSMVDSLSTDFTYLF